MLYLLFSEEDNKNANIKINNINIQYIKYSIYYIVYIVLVIME